MQEKEVTTATQVSLWECFDVVYHVNKHLSDQARTTVANCSKAANANIQSIMRSECYKKFEIEPTQDGNAIFNLLQRITTDSWDKDINYRKGQQKRAIELLRKPAHINTSWANYYLSLIYCSQGKVENAIEHLKLACLVNEEGESSKYVGQAAYALGGIHFAAAMRSGIKLLAFEPWENIEKTLKESPDQKGAMLLKEAKLYYELANKNGYKPASVALAATALTNGHYKPTDVIPKLEQAAKEGNGQAAYLLAGVYNNGPVASSKEVTRGEIMAKLLGDGESTSSAEACYVRGEIYVKQDLKKAQDYLTQAARKNFVPALRELGLAYRDGNAYGIAQDQRNAEDYLQKAVQHGDNVALNALCDSYKNGIGCIPRDSKKYEASIYKRRYRLNTPETRKEIYNFSRYKTHSQVAYINNVAFIFPPVAMLIMVGSVIYQEISNSVSLFKYLTDSLDANIQNKLDSRQPQPANNIKAYYPS